LEGTELGFCLLSRFYVERANSGGVPTVSR